MVKKQMLNRHQHEMTLVCWEVENPQAIMVISHGASEHIYRYGKLARYLNEQQIMVYGYNQLGHGDNIVKDINGVFFDDTNGATYLVDDLEDVCLTAYQQYPNIPLIVFGHSMGSLIVRAWSFRTRLMVDKIIICGSLNPKKTLVDFGFLLAKLETKFLGKYHISKLLNGLAFGSLEKQISYNQDNINKYKNDQNCGKCFSNQAIVDLLKIIKAVEIEKNIAKMLKTKYYFISGQDDPFSDRTKQIQVLMKLLDKYNIDYTYKFYEGMKHEIINEINSEIVYQDIVKSINEIKK